MCCVIFARLIAQLYMPATNVKLFISAVISRIYRALKLNRPKHNKSAIFKESSLGSRTLSCYANDSAPAQPVDENALTCNTYVIKRRLQLVIAKDIQKVSLQNGAALLAIKILLSIFTNFVIIALHIGTYTYDLI